MALVDEDTNSKPTADANRAVRDNIAVQLTPLVTKLITNTRGAVGWPNFKLMQLTLSGGQILVVKLFFKYLGG